MTADQTSRQIAKIEEWLRTFHPLPGEVVELRVLGVQGKKAVCLISNNLGALAERAALMDSQGAKGCYFTPNPLRPDLAGASVSARKADVIGRHWLLIDCDSIREPSTNATEEERQAAWQVLQRARGMLDTAGLVGAVVGDSGNGWHLCYPIDLPASDDVQGLLKSILAGLGKRCTEEGQAQIDPSTHDAPRIWKLYGTRTRKGPHTEERPQRWARLIEGQPWNQETAQRNTTLLADLPSQWQYVEDLRRGRPETTAATYAVAALRAELSALKSAAKGDRNNQLNRSAFALGQLVGAGVISRVEVEDALSNTALEIGLEAHEALATLRSGIAAGMAQPRDLSGLGFHGQAGGKGGPSPSFVDAMPPGASLIVRASEVTPRSVEWLWPGRIPLGKLTTFAGMGGLGKTFTLCDIAARVSRGLPWPDGPDIVHPAGQVLFVSGEDDPEDTLVPRLIELGADLGRVCFLKTEVLDRFSLADLKALDEILSQIGPEVRLVAIDPPTAFLGTVDDHKNAELRGLLSPLKSWAFRQQCAVIFNTHLNKGHGNKVEALTRVMGSVAWVNAVRAAFLFVRDPDDEKLERRFFVPMKMNLAREKPGLAYRIQSTTGDRAKVEWLGEINLSADEAVIAGTKVKVKTINAAEWLIERFREKREWPSTELFQAANQDGIKRDAVFEAKRILELPKAKLIYSVEGKRIWVWWVPDDWVGFERPYDPPS